MSRRCGPVAGSLVHRVASCGPGRSRLTTRFRAELGCAVAEQQRCVSEAAAHHGANWPIVHNAFVEHVRVPLAAPLPPVKVLGIDETRRGKLIHGVQDFQLVYLLLLVIFSRDFASVLWGAFVLSRTKLSLNLWSPGPPQPGRLLPGSTRTTPTPSPPSQPSWWHPTGVPARKPVIQPVPVQTFTVVGRRRSSPGPTNDLTERRQWLSPVTTHVTYPQGLPFSGVVVGDNSCRCR